MSYKRIPVRRGFTEIKSVFEIVDETGGMICGGYPRQMCNEFGNRVGKNSDLDIFFLNQKSFDTTLEALKAKKFGVELQSDRAVTLGKAWNDETYWGPRVQLIEPKKSYKSFENLMDSFDLSCCQAGLISPTECLVSSAFHSTDMSGEIEVVDASNPINTVMRIIKYVNMGYKIQSGSIVELLDAWKDMSDSQRNILESTSTGFSG